jgi:hypothetical protein
MLMTYERSSLMQAQITGEHVFGCSWGGHDSLVG